MFCKFQHMSGRAPSRAWYSHLISSTSKPEKKLIKKISLKKCKINFAQCLFLISILLLISLFVKNTFCSCQGNILSLFYPISLKEICTKRLNLFKAFRNFLLQLWDLSKETWFDYEWLNLNAIFIYGCQPVLRGL